MGCVIPFLFLIAQATTLKNNKILVTMETSGARSEFSKYSFARTESLSPSFGASYEHGEPVALVGGKTSRYFSVPVQDWSGVCSSYNPAAFGAPPPPPRHFAYNAANNKESEYKALQNKECMRSVLIM